MTDILLKYLKQKYNSIDGVSAVDISGYPPPNGVERICFIYKNVKYLKTDRPILSTDQIISIADKIFDDVSHEFHERLGDRRNIITSHNEIIATRDKINEQKFIYQSRYDCHDIELGELDKYIHITISTGNRGRADLLHRQRNKYANFLERIIHQSVKNCK